MAGIRPTQNAVGADDGGTGDLAPAQPAYATAIGKALLAFSPTSVVNRVIAEELQTANTMTSPDNLRQALSVIRLTQIATAHDEGTASGRSAIAMPVFACESRVAAAVELTVREPGTDLKVVTGALTVACREPFSATGHRGVFPGPSERFASAGEVQRPRHERRPNLLSRTPFRAV